MALIKCPECGHEVSDGAPQCPYCGVKIAGNIITCPDCGKILLKGKDTCPNCGCTLTPQDDPSPRNVDSISAGRPGTSHPRNSGNNAKWIWIAVVIIVLAIAGLGYYFVHSQQKSQAMEQAYNALQGDNDVADYEDFLQQYPESPYANMVKDRMNQLKQIQNKWVEISMSSSKGDFVQFLNQYPNSQFEQAAKNKIDSLDWIEVSTENTAEAYQRYMNEHPDGKYIELCRQGKSNLDKVTVTPEDKSGVRGSLRTYFSAISANDAASLSGVVQDKMYDQSVQFMEKLHAAGNKSSFTMQGFPAVSKAPSTDGGFVFIAKFRASKVETDANGESHVANYNVTTTLSDSYQIISMKMTKIVEQPSAVAE